MDSIAAATLDDRPYIVAAKELVTARNLHGAEDNGLIHQIRRLRPKLEKAQAEHGTPFQGQSALGNLIAGVFDPEPGRSRAKRASFARECIRVIENDWLPKEDAHGHEQLQQWWQKPDILISLIFNAVSAIATIGSTYAALSGLITGHPLAEQIQVRAPTAPLPAQAGATPLVFFLAPHRATVFHRRLSALHSPPTQSSRDAARATISNCARDANAV